MEELSLVVEKEFENKRVDAFIAEVVEDLSRSQVQNLINSDLVTVNGKPTKPNYKVKESDEISLTFEEEKEVEIVAENIPLDIVYEDSDVIVVNKPKGMVVHPAVGHYTGTLVNALMYHCGDSLSGINGEKRPGIVHRIDKDTSGLLMIAKNDKAHALLSEQLAKHTITRKYIAIVHNGFKEDSGTVDQPIGRNPKDRMKMAITHKHSRNAVTHYRVLERLKSFTLIEAQLETGRTHQIRVHMTFIGHPLLGDTVYGVKKQPFKTDGQALHAKTLGFIHPSSGEYIEFHSEVPESFQKILNRLQD